MLEWASHILLYPVCDCLDRLLLGLPADLVLLQRVAPLPHGRLRAAGHQLRDPCDLVQAADHDYRALPLPGEAPLADHCHPHTRRRQFLQDVPAVPALLQQQDFRHLRRRLVYLSVADAERVASEGAGGRRLPGAVSGNHRRNNPAVPRGAAGPRAENPEEDFHQEARQDQERVRAGPVHPQAVQTDNRPARERGGRDDPAGSGAQPPVRVPEQRVPSEQH